MDYLDSQGYRFDYCFADFESETRNENTLEMVDQVRAHSNPNISGARIGNYGDFPGPIDLSPPYTGRVDRADKHEFYLTSGLDVAQPNCYPYEYYSTHTNSGIWGSEISPNVRSALFWAPLEKYSVAKRYLPDGHELIPWINAFVPWDGYEAPPPPEADRAALLEHMRLRGADGYYSLGSMNPDLPREEYMQELQLAWHGLDDFFAPADEVTILNLATDKKRGLEWSGQRRGDTVRILVSNLGNVTERVDLPAIGGLPDYTPYVSPGEHLWLNYTWQDGGAPESTRPQLEVNFETYVPNMPLSDQGWHGTSGHGPNEMMVYAPEGTGNESLYALSPVPNDPDTPDWNEGYTAKAWTFVEQPTFDSDDIVCYTAKMRGSSGAGFMPVNTDDGQANPDDLIFWTKQGPYFYCYWSKFRIRGTSAGGDNYQAVNVIGDDIDPDDWWEVRVVVDQRRDIDDDPEAGNYGVGRVLVRNLSEGQTDWTTLIFDNDATDDVVENLELVPLSFAGNHPVDGPGGHPRNPTVFDGWQVYAYGHGTMLDDLSASAVLLGDFDGNGALNGLDIPEFKSALADPAGWWAANPEAWPPDTIGDFNGDGVLNGLDIPLFKNALSGTAIPEPVTTMLLVGAMAVLVRRRGIV
jgi:hypothetical protein